jgi:hypothetical protein
MSYGDLGKGFQVAAFDVGCDNGGGTAAGQLAFAVIIFEVSDGQLRVLGTLTPQKQTSGVHTTSYKRRASSPDMSR